MGVPREDPRRAGAVRPVQEEDHHARAAREGAGRHVPRRGLRLVLVVRHRPGLGQRPVLRRRLPGAAGEVYVALGEPVPDFVRVPIIQPAAVAAAARGRGLLLPDGRRRGRGRRVGPCGARSKAGADPLGRPARLPAVGLRRGPRVLQGRALEGPRRVRKGRVAPALPLLAAAGERDRDHPAQGRALAARRVRGRPSGRGSGRAAGVQPVRRVGGPGAGRLRGRVRGPDRGDRRAALRVRRARHRRCAVRAARALAARTRTSPSRRAGRSPCGCPTSAPRGRCSRSRIPRATTTARAATPTRPTRCSRRACSTSSASRCRRTTRTS